MRERGQTETPTVRFSGSLLTGLEQAQLEQIALGRCRIRPKTGVYQGGKQAGGCCQDEAVSSPWIKQDSARAAGLHQDEGGKRLRQPGQAGWMLMVASLGLNQP